MKINSKITLGFVFIYFCMIIIAGLVIDYVSSEVKSQIGSSLMELAMEDSDAIDKDIFNIENFVKSLGQTSFVILDAIKESNARTAAIGSEEAIQKYIYEKDKEWKSAPGHETTPFMKEIIDSRASARLRSTQDYFKKVDGFNLFSEIFVTNKYGINVAQTAKTSGYMHADEEWWQISKKEGHYVSGIEYKKSFSNYSLVIGSVIKDEEGKFVGVLKAVVDLAEMRSVINEAKEGLRYKDSSVELVDGKGYRWYGIGPSGYMAKETSGGSAPDIVIAGNSGFTVEKDKDTSRTVLRAFGHSRGFKGYKGFGGAVIINVDADEIFVPVGVLAHKLIIIFFILLLAIAFIGRLISLTISKPIHELRKGMEIIGNGNLDHRVGTAVPKDEIGQLARSFDYMIFKLKAATVSRDEILREVEERRKIEMELRRLVSVVEHSEDAVIGKTLDGYIFSWNSGAQKIYGYSYDEVKGKHVSIIIPPDRLDEFNQVMEKVKNGNVVEHMETVRVRKDGRKLDMSLTFSPIKDGSANVIGISSIGRDVTIRKKAEMLLRENEQKLRALFDQTFQFIGLLTLDGILIEANRAALQLANVDEADVLGKFFWDTPWWTHSPQLQEKLKEAIKRSSEGEFVRFEATHPDKDGNLHNVDFSLKPVRDENGKVIFLLPEGHDITEIKKAEEELRTAYTKLKKIQAQLVQASKMASVGMLAGGVAHEINNPLTGVLNNIQLLKMMIDKGVTLNSTELKEILDIIEESSLRCKNITQSLLSFSRASRGDFTKLDLNEIVNAVVGLVEHEVNLNNISINKQLESGIPAILGDAQLLKQVVFDMIHNATWAIRKKLEKDAGHIYIETYYDSKKDRIFLLISDDGIGIPEEYIDKVFEPFFTTKPVGEGTGLGLSIVFNIISGHKGTIKVENRDGGGALFRISLLPAERAKGHA